MKNLTLKIELMKINNTKRKVLDIESEEEIKPEKSDEFEIIVC